MHTANVEQGIYAQDEAVVVDVDRDKIRSVAHARAVTPLPQYASRYITFYHTFLIHMHIFNSFSSRIDCWRDPSLKFSWWSSVVQLSRC